MASAYRGVVGRQLERLFGAGTVAGLSEVQLLEQFIANRDEAAFAALVERHGPMVLAVCKQILRNAHDADDAFQATFLVLARKAGSLRKRELLGNWLYGVALRVSQKARASAARRRDREGPGAEDAAVDVQHDTQTAELRPVLHEELARLPEKYRAPIVLCYLEGQTHEAAAAHLRWPLGTVKGRLARAKDLLKSRLARRGLGLASALVLSDLAQGAGAAAVIVPPALVESTARAAILAAAGQAAGVGLVSAGAAALTEGVLKTMYLTKLKIAGTALLAFGTLATGAGVWAYQEGGGAGGGTGSVGARPDHVEQKAAAAKAGGIAATKDNIATQRLELAENVLNQLGLAYMQGAKPDGPNGERIYLWSKRLLEAEREARPAGQAAALAAHLERMRNLEKQTQARMQAGQASSVDALEAEYYRKEAELMLAEAQSGGGASGATGSATGGMAMMPGMMMPGAGAAMAGMMRSYGGGGGMAGPLPGTSAGGGMIGAPPGSSGTAGSSAGAGTPSRMPGGGAGDHAGPGAGAMGGGGFGGMGGNVGGIRLGGFGGGMGGVGFGAGTRPITLKEAREDPANKLVFEKLDQKVALEFPDESPLEQVLQHIKQQTKGAEDKGLPIYVDPVGLQEAEKTLQSPVCLDISGVPLRTTLRLLLSQLGLVYTVDDGLVIITSDHSDLIPSVEIGTGPQAGPTGTSSAPPGASRD